MARLIWSEIAIEALDEICRYLERTSEEFAKSFARGVRAAVEELKEFPYIGQIVPEYDQDDLRERLFHNHRIIYRVRPDEIEVVTVFSAFRRMPRNPPG